MRHGVHAALWMRTWRDDVLPLIRTAAEMGFGAVELSLLGGDADERERTRLAAREAGVGLTCTTGLGPGTDVGAVDPDVRAAGRAALEEAIAQTAACGADRLSGVIYGAWGAADPARRADRWAYAVEALRSVADRARDEGVRLGIEAINRYETDLVNTARQAREMADATERPEVGVLLDAYHMNIEEKDPADAVRACGDRLLHLHVAGNDRGVPADATLDWASLATALHEVRYAGDVTLEMFVQAGEEVSPDLTVWRDVEADATDAARRGLAFLRRWFA